MIRGSVTSGANFWRSTPRRAPFRAPVFNALTYDGAIWPAARDLVASSASAPTITSSRIAISVTLLAIGPGVSCTESKGTKPVRDTRPTVGRSPAKALKADGTRTEPPVSDPIPTTPKFAATDAPVPPEDPPDANAVLYGLRTRHGTTELMLSVRPSANSERDAFARIIPPASRIFLQLSHPRAERNSSSPGNQKS